MRSLRAWLVFAVAFAWFSVRAANAWLASGYVDPIGHFGTQDEAFYSRVVIEMLRGGQWLTPTLLGRLAYFKPPLLYWVSATSVFLFGPTRYAFRLPSILAGAGICALSFHWVDKTRGPYSAAVTAVLLMADCYLVTFSSVNMMDALAAFFGLLALRTFAGDSQLVDKWSLCVCSVALAAGVMTKSVAGVIPALVIGVYWVADRLLTRAARNGGYRPILSLAAITTALASPWFVYSLVVHGRWFWNEHVQTELFSGATGANPLSTADPNLVFYAQRFFLGDPFTAVVCSAGVLVAIFRRRAGGLLITWLALTLVSLLVFRQHAAAYLLPVIVAACILSGLALPVLSRRSAILFILVLIVGEAAYLAKAAPIVWTGTNNQEARALTDYCNLNRGNSLFIVDPDDEYYFAVLPLPRVYYGMLNQGRIAIRQSIDWRFLGVMVTVDQFENQDKSWPVFRQRLTEFGLSPTLDPRATIVLYPEISQVRTLITNHPELDFYLPEIGASDKGEHDVWEPTSGRVWLLSRMSKARTPQQVAGRFWACRL
jgi:4-amino-4-deoxy-L-arabinose transferase-like glycosyltransferase